MSYVVNNHLNNLYVLSNKAVGPGKNPKLINVGPTSIPQDRVKILSGKNTQKVNKQKIQDSENFVFDELNEIYVIQ